MRSRIWDGVSATPLHAIVDAHATALLGEKHLEAVALSTGEHLAVRGALVAAPTVDKTAFSPPI